MWRQYPTEIGADLLAHYGVDIADWHRGTRDKRGWLKVSSRHLLEMIEHLPERMAFKTALRDGDWPTDTKILAEMHKELAMFHAGHRREGDRAFMEFLSPLQMRKRYAEFRGDAEEGAEEIGGLFDQVGFS